MIPLQQINVEFMLNIVLIQENNATPDEIRGEKDISVFEVSCMGDR